MSEVAELLLEWVFTSAFLILVVLALRAALGRRMSSGLRYGLWAVVLVRLLVPVQLFTSPIAGTWVMTEERTERDAAAWPAADGVQAAVGPDDVLALDVPALPEGAATFPQAPDPPTMPDAPEPPDLGALPGWVAYLGWAWLAGAAAVSFVLLGSNLRFYWQLRRERIPLDGAELPLRAYVAVGLPSPCLFGVARPAVYVTPEAAADPAMLRHVLAHEYTHYKHGDHIWSLLRCAALAAHWWNPLVWLAAVLSQRDGELACDEGALKRLGDGERAAYGGTLLALVTAKPRPGDLFRCATTMAGDKKSLKERISRIAQAPRRVVWAVVVAVVVTALACVCAFGQAEPEEEGGAPDSPEQYDLHFSINERGDVAISGTVDGLTLGENTYWHPAVDAEHPITYLALEYPPYIAGNLEAWWWDDAGRTSVMVSTAPMTREFSDDDPNTGFWSFIVDLSDGTGTVTEMRALASAPARAESETLRLYPETVSNEEAAATARIAAVLMREAEEYYNGTSVADRIARFPSDLKDVPAEVLDVISQDVLGRYKQFLVDLDRQPIAVGNSGLPEFDGWRVKDLQGPWAGAQLGMDLEIWRVFREYHTPEPEKAEYMLTGGMYVTEEGWFSPEDCWNYYLFRLDPQGGRSIAAVMSVGAGGGAPDGETQYLRDSFDAMVEQVLQAADGFPQTDLNRNGVPEELRVSGTSQGTKLEIWENGTLLFEEEGFHAHAGYNSLFLYQGGGQDYLLRYQPTMYGGICTYTYKLFTLENGEETTVRENSLEFDINFQPWLHEQYDAKVINAFMGEINSLLAGSTQLLNTDDYLLATFEREGRLYDSLWWLDNWAPTFVRDESKSLLNNLLAYEQAMKAEWYAETPEVFPVDELGTDIRLSYRDKAVRFSSPGWDYNFQPAEHVEPAVIDLNGDGRDEIVIVLICGHGTGCIEENLYVFDADTLEQYDTLDLNKKILAQVESTGDEDSFYLSAPWMERVAIPRNGAEQMNFDAPMADALALGEVVQYTVADGQVLCRLGCDASGMTTNYIGYVNVPVRLTPSGGFQCGNGWYEAGDSW